MEKGKSDMTARLLTFVATGFGIGLVVPFAPGTFGSLPGVALAYALAALPPWLQIAACLGFTLLAIPVCEVAERTLGLRDDGRIAADEWLLFPIACIGLPLRELPWWALLVFFVVVRAVDILKPWPARQAQALPGGRGIVADDLIANLYALAANWLLFVFFFK
jgi:phosphatidylglycerophosphatase A